MLSQVFQKHHTTNFVSVQQLESDMKAQLAIMQQTVQQMKEPVAAPMTMQQSFAAVSPDVRRANRTMDFADNVAMDMAGLGLDFEGGAAGSLFSVALDICDTFSPNAADAMEEITQKGNLNASVEAAVELRDQATANPRVQQAAKQAFEKDMERYAREQKIHLGKADSVQGLENRVKIMQERLEKVGEARVSGVQYVELDDNGINLPDMNYQSGLGWKNARVGYQTARVQQGMRLAA